MAQSRQTRWAASQWLLGRRYWIFPLVGVHIGLSSNVEIACLMMLQSLVRQFAFRRFFVWLDRPKHRPPTPESLLLMMLVWDNPDWKALKNHEGIVRLGQR